MRRTSPALLLLLLSACQNARSKDAPLVAPSPYAATGVGRIDVEQEARQLVAATDGVITHVLVQRGDTVVVGQPMLRVDCRPRVRSVGVAAAQSAQLSAAAQTVRAGARSEDIAAMEAQLGATIAQASDAQDRLDRANGLVDRGFVTQREIEARENALTMAQAEKAAMSAHLDLLRNGSRRSEIAAANAAARAARAETGVAKAMADQCVMRSPVSGQILQILRREGEFSGASQGVALIVVGDLSQLTVRAEINERDAARVAAGQRADIWIEGNRTRWKGHVTHLASIMGRRSARSLDPTDRFDRDTREAFVAFDGATPPALVGLRVNVGVRK